jgi:hypothetical protein
MEASLHTRGRGVGHNDGMTGNRRPPTRNKQWVAEHNGPRSTSITPAHNEGERWERGSHRGGGRARGATRGVRRFPNATLSRTQDSTHLEVAGHDSELDGEGSNGEEPDMTEDPDPDTPEEREKFYLEVGVQYSKQTSSHLHCTKLVKAREIERKKAIAEGKMDDPLVPKRLEDAITLVGTCMDMCPRFERYRRERENNLFEWETVGCF